MNCRHSSYLVYLSLSCAIILSVRSPAVAQQRSGRTEILRGRVLSDSGTIIRDADVVIVSGAQRTERRAITDSIGFFEVTFNEGPGDYLVHVIALGWAPWRKRVTLEKDSVAFLDIQIKARPIALAPVAATAERQKPPGKNALEREIGSRDDIAAGLHGAIPPLSRGDVNSAASIVPGVLLTPDGASMLGLSPFQNEITLNGMTFNGADLPREARSWTRASSSTYDPVRGGFGAGHIALELARGGSFSSSRAHATLDAPQTWVNDRSLSRAAQQSVSQVSVGGDGELVRDRYVYNAAAQLSRTVGYPGGLIAQNQAELNNAKLSADSVALFLQLLNASGLRVLGHDRRVTQAASFVARIDQAPRARGVGSITIYAKASSGIVQQPALAASSIDTRSTSIRAMLQGEYSTYFYKNYLNTFTTALSYSGEEFHPTARVPEGNVRVSTVNDSLLANPSIALLLFGGAGGRDMESGRLTWQTTNVVQWFSRSSQHKYKIYTDVRFDSYRHTENTNSAGIFSYSSLADLELNRPTMFSRVLGDPTIVAGAWNGVIAVSDQIRRSRLALLVGARLEGTYFTNAPAINNEVALHFESLNSAVPNRLHVSPRVGFTYNFTGDNTAGFSSNRLGARMLVPKGLLRGGFGEFRSSLRPTLGALQGATSLGASSQMVCIGSSVPRPDWRELLSGGEVAPTCATGSTGFEGNSYTVNGFDRSYDAARSWRASLGWTGVFWGLLATVDGVYSLNMNQPSIIDLNFKNEPSFTLPSEKRPVFVDASSIDPETGIVRSVAARTTAGFGQVLSRRSDLSGVGRQLTVTITPGSGVLRPNYFVTGAYTLSDSRAEVRGFDGAAFGDPNIRERGPSSYDARHLLQLQTGYTRNGWLSISMFGLLSSGTPFTPVVAADVNGDGVAWDRAFVHETDSNAAVGMRSLIREAPKTARDCLSEQLGRVAEHNSCRTPWNIDVTSQIQFGRSMTSLGSNRINISINLVNMLSGFDQLIHGQSGIRGWGRSAAPDPVLYQVRGFDPKALAFKYAVNPFFGRINPSRAGGRTPFRATLDVSVDLGVPIGQQQLSRSLAPGRRMGAADIQKMYARNVTDVFRAILEHTDSLMLTQKQVIALRNAQQTYRLQIDTVWRHLATYFVSLPGDYNRKEAMRRQEAAIDEAWEINWKQGPVIKSVLTPLQLGMVPGLVSILLNASTPPRIRASSN